MSNEQKHGFFSRILKTPSTSEPADSPPDSTAETASSDMMTATAMCSLIITRGIAPWMHTNKLSLKASVREKM